MKRFRVPEIALGLLLGILVSLFGAGVTSYQTAQCNQAKASNAHPPSLQQPAPPHENGKDGKAQVTEHSKHPPYFGCGWTGIPASVVGFMDSHEGFFVGGFTFLLVFVTGWLVKATIRLAEDASDTAKRQSAETRILQRAYIAVGAGGILPLDAKSVAHIEVSNVGNLPAREVSWFIDYAIDTDGQRRDFPVIEDQFYGQNVIPPGTTMNRSQNCILDQQDIMALEDSEELVSFYVWGEIRYLDGFDVRRVTRFCHRYNNRGLVQAVTQLHQGGARTITDRHITAESMRYHQHGNDAD